MRPGDPVWTEKVEEQEIAQDPLAMNRVMNRLLEDLLPGITTISPRARYISHHLWAARDVIQRDNPESRPEFLEGMYQRERILLLVSVRHDQADFEEQRNHKEIVGIREGRKIIDREEDPLSLDFRFFANRGGSFGQAYIGPLKTMGLLEIDEATGFESPTEQGEEIAEAYAELANESGLAEISQEKSISQDKLSNLPYDQCLCQICEPDAPDRNTLRDLYLGRSAPAGHRTSSHSRGRSLLLLLHLADRTSDETSLSPSMFLDACYFGTIETEDGLISANIPKNLKAQATRWKVLRAHDYLTYAAEVVFEAWLDYLETNERDATISNFVKNALSSTTLEKLESNCDINDVDPSTPFSTLLNGIWPNATVEDVVYGEEKASVSMDDSVSEHNLDAALTSAKEEKDWPEVHAQWPRLTLAMALRFGSPKEKEPDAWSWMASHTEKDLSPARFLKKIKELLWESATVEDFISWFIQQYVINQAMEVRNQRSSGSNLGRGWFEKRGGHWEKTRDYSAGHWSARFNSARSVLRDLAYLNPNPKENNITADGLGALEEAKIGETDAN